MKSKWTSEKEILEQLILVEKLSYEEIGRKYECSGANIKKVAKKLGIELENRRKINPCETFNKGCSRQQVIEDGIKTIKIVKEPRRCLNCGTVLGEYSKKYCSNDCQLEYQHKEQYKKIIDGDPSIMRGNYSPKNFKKDIIAEQGGICSICGMNQEWNGKSLTFILDHIDGNAANNKRDNLRCICPNCDSQLETYKSKNKNSARHYYRYHKHDKDIKLE